LSDKLFSDHQALIAQTETAVTDTEAVILKAIARAPKQRLDIFATP
jgi:hypothetical protein